MVCEPVGTSPGSVSTAGAAPADFGLWNLNHPPDEAAWDAHVQA